MTISPTRNRTRQAILDAAIETLAQQPAASLGDIAAAAGVGRTTLHRYFAERSDLMSAVVTEAGERLTRATVNARLGEGTGAEAVLRLCREYFDLGAVLSLVFGEAQLLAGDDCFGPDDGDTFATAVARGHADGSIDPRLPATWLDNLMWAQLYAACHFEGHRSRHEVLDLLVRSYGGALRPYPAS
ncbi:TetR/AcrR family transcriptional regulator [Paractinoplanes rishiriensis]|uniref:TetR family transcriptional regulator n=1 Tax=Paractinoplanes rishiriensis TaxID=1050105 RepID=A0A919JYL2_9ACTN|nr:TetR/AcrR family transcriptional regulator [Actinoplanes rishiriensis]GIE95463.1 TetR family transcriptional regulator [Actinoplanes rishiriensis]